MKKYFIIFLIFACVGVFEISVTQAATITISKINALSGWAWSPNIGWVSLNSADQGAGGATYNIKVDDEGNLIGYGWSSSIGWIKFGGLSSFPDSSGNAKVNLATGVVSGWARACAGTASGSCSVMNSRTDGWDGWINLAGANFSSSELNNCSNFSNCSGGVFLKTVKATGNTVSKLLNGFGWGNVVVGWLRFNAQFTVVDNLPIDSTNPSPTPVYPPGGGGGIVGVCLTDPNDEDIEIGVTANFVVVNSIGRPMSDGYYYSWSKSQSTGYQKPSLDSKVANFSWDSPGSYTVSVKVADSIANLANAGVSNCGTVNVSNPKALDLYIGPATDSILKEHTIRKGQKFALNWNVEPEKSNFICDSTVKDQNEKSVSVFGNQAFTVGIGTYKSSKSFSSNETKVIPIGLYTFTLKCRSDNKAERSSSVKLRVTSVSQGEF
ncbi:MAG: hypothetical protein WC666_01830 [Candidatus Paceibacterota bacterium]